VGEKPARMSRPLLGYLSVGAGPEPRELFAGEWLAGCSISFDRAT